MRRKSTGGPRAAAARRWPPYHELNAPRVWRHKLTPAEYEETTWSARSWTTFAAQKISVALHYAAAFEISMALRVPKFDQAELDAAAARRMAGGG